MFPVIFCTKTRHLLLSQECVIEFINKTAHFILFRTLQAYGLWIPLRYDNRPTFSAHWREHQALLCHHIASSILTGVSALLEKVTECLCLMCQTRYQLWIKTARTRVSVACISSDTNQLAASTSDRWLATLLIESIYIQKPIYSAKLGITVLRYMKSVCRVFTPFYYATGQVLSKGNSVNILPFNLLASIDKQRWTETCFGGIFIFTTWSQTALNS